MVFWNALEQYGSNIALITQSGSEITYTELARRADEIAGRAASRCLAFLVCRNCAECVEAYLGFLRRGIVPVLIAEHAAAELLDGLLEAYRPSLICLPAEHVAAEKLSGTELWRGGEYVLLRMEGEPDYALADELALMLTTSGSTGSPKFVRQSYRNIDANTTSIVEYLGIRPEDRAITTMPMSYTYGLSIIQSHLMAGATVVLTEQTFFDRGFWDFFRAQRVTTFGAVPYTYQMLDKLRFLRMELPSLRYITQAGGRLGEELHRKFAEGLRAQGKSLIVMYGATEATARMSYVPADHAVEKAGSIGVAIPGGRFELVDVDGSVITEPDTVGELVYYGDNVTLGYAQSRADLAKSDERGGRLETGDMAKRDADGYYYVVGRKKRFLKIYGNRVNLVEIEDLFAKAGYETACVGEDDHMRVYTTSADTDGAVDYISEKTGLNRAAFTAIHIDAIPHNESGKVLYSALEAK